jgi:hypothetical protein
MLKTLQESIQNGKKTMTRVVPISRSGLPAGMRCTRVLADGRLLAINGLGVLELYRYNWLDGNDKNNSNNSDSVSGGSNSRSQQDLSVVTSTTSTAAAEGSQGLVHINFNLLKLLQ